MQGDPLQEDTQGMLLDALESQADPCEVQIRVHGVSGTPPENMLDAVSVRQVAGDELGRFFQPSDVLKRPIQPNTGEVVEGYHWGQLTAGSWRQGLWLLLIPFGLVNAAAYMLPDPYRSTAAARWWQGFCLATIRLLGLALTGVFALAAATFLLAHLGPAAERITWLSWAPSPLLGLILPLLAGGLMLALATLGRVQGG